MSGFLYGDQAAHYAYGAARAIHAGEWDQWLEVIARAIADRTTVVDGGAPTGAPSPAEFAPGARS